MFRRSTRRDTREQVKLLISAGNIPPDCSRLSNRVKDSDYARDLHMQGHEGISGVAAV